MGRIFGLILIVVAIYVGLEIYTEGTHGAFGGAFSKLGLAGPAPTDAAGNPQRPTEVIREKVTEDMSFGEARREGLVDKMD